MSANRVRRKKKNSAGPVCAPSSISRPCRVSGRDHAGEGAMTFSNRTFTRNRALGACGPASAHRPYAARLIFSSAACFERNRGHVDGRQPAVKVGIAGGLRTWPYRCAQWPALLVYFRRFLSRASSCPAFKGSRCRPTSLQITLGGHRISSSVLACTLPAGMSCSAADCAAGGVAPP